MIERLDFVFESVKPDQKISFDADGVLIDSRSPVIEKFNSRFEQNRVYEEVTGWNSLVDWCVERGCPKEEAEKINFEIWTDPDILAKSKPLYGGLDVYRYFLKQGYSPPVITVRNHLLRDVTFAWFNKYLPEVDKEMIRMRQDKTIGGDDFKLREIEKNRSDWHFDDSEEITRKILKSLNKTRIFHIALAQNLEISKNKRVTVIPYWEWSPRT